jgi:hypothetical protein
MVRISKYFRLIAVGAALVAGLATAQTQSVPATCTLNSGVLKCETSFLLPSNATINAVNGSNQLPIVCTGTGCPGTGGTVAQSITISTATASGVAATASSGLAVVYGTSTPTVCTINASSGAVAALQSGNCAATFNQPGNATYAPAPQVTQQFPVTSSLQSQTITFNPPSSGTAPGTAALSASASSQLAVSLVSNSPSTCTMSGTTVTYVTPGTCSITASQAGNSTFAAAPDVTRTIAVTQGSGGSSCNLTPNATLNFTDGLRTYAYQQMVGNARWIMRIAVGANDSTLGKVSGATFEVTQDDVSFGAARRISVGPNCDGTGAEVLVLSQSATVPIFTQNDPRNTSRGAGGVTGGTWYLIVENVDCPAGVVCAFSGQWSNPNR